MRIATFNLESLDLPVKKRTAVLRPALERLEADILCLQEVNAQHIAGRPQRIFLALDQLLEGTAYSSFHRVSTVSVHSEGPADVHNLVTLSRWPMLRHRQIWHDLVPPVHARLAMAQPALAEPHAVVFDRPMLITEFELGGSTLIVINVHLRAPLAAGIPGQKAGPFTWNSVGGWAEGYYLAGLKRSGQALELRLLVDGMLDADPDALVVAAGDFNAEDYETPLRIVAGAPEDTGNADLAGHAMVVLDRALDPGRRFSAVHHGRPQMLDHMLATHGLYGRFRGIEVHNEALGDEAVGYARGVEAAASYHAAMVASFNFNKAIAGGR